MSLQLYSFSKSAKLLALGKETLKHLIDSGRIGVIKINNRMKIAHSEIEEFIQSNTIREKLLPDNVDATAFFGSGFRKSDDKNNPVINDETFQELIKQKHIN